MRGLLSSLILIFLAKNECPSVRRDPIFISRLRGEEGGPHPLCPVGFLDRFLKATGGSRSSKLFIHPHTLEDLSVNKLRLYICKFIRMADPTSFPRSHDLRKMATSFAFFRSLSTEEICNVVGWSSIRVFRRHYLRQIQEVSSPIIVLGSRVAGSVSQD